MITRQPNLKAESVNFPRIVICSHSMHSKMKVKKIDHMNANVLNDFYGLLGTQHQINPTEIHSLMLTEKAKVIQKY